MSTARRAFIQANRYVVTDTERALRKTIIEVVTPYESEYRFNNEGGLFVERVISHLRTYEGKWGPHISSALYIALTGCRCRDDGYSIPAKVREEIKEAILAKL
jgi:hypothetical protein